VADISITYVLELSLKMMSKKRRKNNSNGSTETITIMEKVIEHSYSLHLKATDCSEDVLRRIAYITVREPFRLVVSLSPSPLQAVPFSRLLRRFSGIQEFRLLGQKLYSNEVVYFPDLLPELIVLDLDVEGIHPEFPILNLLTPTLRELYLHHNTPIKRFDITNKMVLPNLRVFGSTFPGCLLDALHVPQLETMIWYGAPFPVGNQVGCEAYKEAYKILQRLELEDWIWTGPHHNAVSIFAQLASYSPSLKSVRFTRTYIDGDTLAALLAPLPDVVPTNAIIQEMTISHCVGVTAVQCERLKGLVERLNVYV
jgi:hypothetical protein